MDEYVQTSIDFDAVAPGRAGSAKDAKLILYTRHISGDLGAVSILNTTLSAYGLTIDVVPEPDGEKRVTINFDAQAFKQKSARGAGAKCKLIGRICSLNELRARIEDEGAQAVADGFGISRSTLFRRIKECENCGESTVIL